MIKDYRFRCDSTIIKRPVVAIKWIIYPMVAVGIGITPFAVLDHLPPGDHRQLQSESQENPARQVLVLDLPDKQKTEISASPAVIKSVDPTIETPTGKLESQTGIDLSANGVPQIETTPPATSSSQPEESSATLSEIVISDQSDTNEEAQEPRAVNEVHWIKETVKKGDSISRIFVRINLSAVLLHRILNSSEEAKQLAHIRPGETLKVKIDGEGNFLGLILERNAIKSLNIKEIDGSFQTRTIEKGLETRIANASGTITNSLYQSAQRVGLPDQLIMELANIFGWDIDFALEIRAGDQFSLIYEEEYLDGELYGHGSILAAEFVNRGNSFRAVRYQDKSGNSNFFSPDGRSMRKAFLRAPVDFRRISSHFTKARWHPVLGKKRPHKGVDYAADIGTPIKAAGNGRVIFRGTKGGYGNTVIIQHGEEYTTLYAHMSNFDRSVKNGSRVKQGETIGYVGKSGLATGPHLHYEFRVNGTHRNPLTVKIPKAAPIKKEYREDFKRQSTALLAQLDVIARTQVASAE